VVIAGAHFAEVTVSSESRGNQTLGTGAVAELTETVPTPAVDDVTDGDGADVVGSCRDLAKSEITGNLGGLRVVVSRTIAQLAVRIVPPAIDRFPWKDNAAEKSITTYAHAAEEFVTRDGDGSSIRPVAPAIGKIIRRDRTGRPKARADLVEWDRRQRRGS
jgi:hypothetical protein